MVIEAAYVLVHSVLRPVQRNHLFKAMLASIYGTLQYLLDWVGSVTLALVQDFTVALSGLFQNRHHFT